LSSGGREIRLGAVEKGRTSIFGTKRREPGGKGRKGKRGGPSGGNWWGGKRKTVPKKAVAWEKI